jgi:hypothetical protein
LAADLDSQPRAVGDAVEIAVCFPPWITSDCCGRLQRVVSNAPNLETVLFVSIQPTLWCALGGGMISFPLLLGAESRCRKATFRPGGKRVPTVHAGDRRLLIIQTTKEI